MRLLLGILNLARQHLHVLRDEDNCGRCQIDAEGSTAVMMMVSKNCGIAVTNVPVEPLRRG